jgi:hypothetical protein
LLLLVVVLLLLLLQGLATVSCKSCFSLGLGCTMLACFAATGT